MPAETPTRHPEQAPASPWWEYPALAALLALLVICVWPGMTAPPFSDDLPQLERVSKLDGWKDIFQPDAFRFFRPVKNAIFLAAAPLESNITAWHWIGLAAHLLATIGVHRIATICLGHGRSALLATAFWALSPACVSSILWLSCTNICIGLAIAGLVFHFHERSWMKPSPLSFAAALLAYAGALLCYESLIAVPGLLFVRDLQQRRIAVNVRSAARYGLYTVVAVTFLIVRSQFSAKGIGGGEFHSGFGPDTKPLHLFVSAPWFMWRHFLMWLFPFGTIETLGTYIWMKSASPAALGFAWLLLGLLLGAAAFAWKRLPVASYGILFFIVASLPSGNFIPTFNGPINDAYLTIPSAGLALAFAALVEALFRELAKRRASRDSGVPALAAILILLLAYRLPLGAAYFRHWAGVWSDPVRLTLLMSDTRPYQFQSKGFASSLLFASGYIDQAETLAKEALSDAPWNALGRLTLARVANHRKEPATEQAIFRELLTLPKIPANVMSSSRVELAESLATKPENHEEAADLCRQALKSSQTETRYQIRAMLCLAGIYQTAGDATKARATLERGLGIHPGDDALTAALGKLDQPTP